MLYNEVSFEREVEVRCLEEKEEGRENIVLNAYKRVRLKHNFRVH